mmetsp:Transcript_2532/g.5189  ORF Transcript_2532/g.5189 Transcript_2532/m.5189 type:complete len:122 (-) Transcript_2532:78-443(-)|eukprot:CAMPEP_0172466508 /NCGR_PEP_ID=MMETSP1065-20121228/56354_1 /TAXON_ID=265537 /ORGANISM="Amphiprora paludosa, Strain CCMP125" /LENGTH=121 /DNA_ID=CAMNT_0013223329 /DNA_START=35 /DNA_END=400 /DNA_ORIENTATION=-
MKISASTLAATSLLMSGATAFAPSHNARMTTTSLSNDLFDSEDDEIASASSGSKTKEMSAALPFVPRPKLLDGELAADVGFDPFNFAGADKASLYYMREAEVKHSRLAKAFFSINLYRSFY